MWKKCQVIVHIARNQKSTGHKKRRVRPLLNKTGSMGKILPSLAVGDACESPVESLIPGLEVEEKSGSLSTKKTGL